ncbi:ATP-binding protein [Candidatus Dojkabacteria bacterium]|nr:ATP-binding protein [Candidatus Dojkabacteria bacterium]
MGKKITKSIPTEILISNIISILCDEGLSGIPYSQLFKLISKKYQITRKELDFALIFIKFFGAIEVKEFKDTNIKVITVKSRIARLFLFTLENYIKKGHSLISDWEISGYNEEVNIRNFYRAVEFMYYMENKRVNENNDREPARKVIVVGGVVKAKVMGYEEPLYLMRYDYEAKQFQALGGTNRKFEKNEVFIKKKLVQELILNNLISDVNFEIEEMFRNSPSLTLSKTYGIFTEYEISYYHFITNLEQLKLGQFDRWVSINEIRNMVTKDGYAIMDLEAIYKGFIDTLIKLPLSIKSLQKYHNKLNKGLKFNSPELKFVSAEEIIKKGETSQIEFKSSLRWDFRTKKVNRDVELSIVKTIAAFMNTAGGILLIGVDDKGKVLGLKEDMNNIHRPDMDGFIQHLYNLSSSFLGSDSATFVDASSENIGEESVCVVKINPSDHPIFLKLNNSKELYIRTGNNTRTLDTEESFKYIQSHW